MTAKTAKKKGETEFLNGSQLAKKLKVSRQHIHNLFKEGVLRRDAKKLYNVEECRAIINGRRQFDKNRDFTKDAPAGQSSTPEGIDAAKDPRRAAEYWKAQLTELEFLEKKGRLIDVDLVVKANAFLAGKIRNRLLNIPNRAAPTLQGQTNIKKIAQVIEDEIRDALLELAALDATDIKEITANYFSD